MIDVWMGDDFFHNGAFRQSYGYDYVLGLESTKTETQVSYGKDKDGKPMRRLRLLSRARQLCRGREAVRLQSAANLEALPRSSCIRSVWSSRGVENALNSVTVPTLTVGGYYDQEDMFGPQEEYAKLEPHDTHHENFLVLGPWRHGYWSSSSHRLGNLELRRAHRHRVPQADRGEVLRALPERRAGISISRIRRAFRPARTPGSTTRIFRRRSRGRRPCISAARHC